MATSIRWAAPALVLALGCMAAGAASAQDVTRYCGWFHNQTLHIDETGEIDVDRTGGYVGTVTIGAKLQGGGPFTGQVAGGQCSASDPAGLAFHGPCPDGRRLTANYTIWGQVGVIDMTAGTCRAEPGLSPSPYASAPMPSPPPSEPPQPPLQAPRGGVARYCGVFHNATYNVDSPGEIDLNPGGGFSGNVNVGDKLQGSGLFTGQSSGGQCSATNSAGLAFHGACPSPGGRFSGSYTIWGQQGVFNTSAGACR